MYVYVVKIVHISHIYRTYINRYVFMYLCIYVIKVIYMRFIAILDLNTVFSLHNIYYRKLCIDYHFSPITDDMT